MEGAKKHILESTKEAVRAGGSVECASRFYGIAKSTWYEWEKEDKAGKIGEKKQVVSNHPKKLSDIVEQNILETAKKYLAISTRYAVGFLCGVSATAVGKVLRRFGLAGTKDEKKKDKPVMTYEWLKKDICWTIDTVFLKFKSFLIYLQVLRDEFSRMPLASCYSMTNSGREAAELVGQTIRTVKRRPLVVKHDRGPEFKGKEFEELLREECIVTLTSPGYYPKFNGKHERGNRVFGKLEKLYEGKDVGMFVFMAAVKEAIDFEANILPRMMFGGRTSREVYDGAESYSEEEKKAFFARLLEVKDEVERKKIQKKMDMLDVQRVCVVKSVVDTNLCEVRMRKNANQLSA